jgi:type II secretory pathway pseudopilin PulG
LLVSRYRVQVTEKLVLVDREYRQENDAEAGYVLLAVIFLTLILLVSLAIAAPKIAVSIQRDKELETIHRGQQYKRALKLYYQKYGSYPTSIDQLKETNEIRFLRKVYTDPLTGKADWKPVLFGQAHVRPLGFFGQPLMTAGGIAGGASMYAATATTGTDANGVPIAGGDQSASGAAGSSTNSGFGSSGSSLGSSGSSFGSSGSSLGSSGSNFGSTPGNSSMFGSSTPTGGTGTSSSSPFGSSGSGTSATTFGGGGPIVGFTLPVDKPSLIEYKLQKRYNKWEFNYDPAEDQAQALSGLAGGGTTGTGTGTGTGIGGNGIGGTGIGGNGVGGTNTGTGTGIGGTPPTQPNPTAPTDPTAPQ